MSAGRTLSGRHASIRTNDSDFVVIGLIGTTALGVVLWEMLGTESSAPAPGQLLSVAGRAQHVIEHPGRHPTVVLESGLGNPSSMWSWVIDRLPEETCVVAYDRPGNGWSRANEIALSSARYPDHLLSVLESAGAPSPYLLVGHSIGGLLIRIFAERYPELTAGLVFVDSAHPADMLGSAASDLFTLRRSLDRRILRSVLRLPPSRGLNADLLSLPPPMVRPTVKAMSRVSALRAAHQELALSRHDWAAQSTRLPSITPRPVAVVTAEMTVGSKPDFAAHQEELAALSTVSLSDTVQGATHNSLLTRQSHADRVTRAIVWALNAAQGQSSQSHQLARPEPTT
ncbi:alpha/beta hydrolase [Streptomyces sp. NPDC005799]|uniref:alpha/beta hydrolase n=1 Tax=Streptomyces sp. NPDC005799 TaxID=3154678 RepID=UPI0033D7E85B